MCTLCNTPDSIITIIVKTAGCWTRLGWWDFRRRTGYGRDVWRRKRRSRGRHSDGRRFKKRVMHAPLTMNGIHVYVSATVILVIHLIYSGMIITMNLQRNFIDGNPTPYIYTYCSGQCQYFQIIVRQKNGIVRWWFIWNRNATSSQIDVETKEMTTIRKQNWVW